MKSVLLFTFALTTTISSAQFTVSGRVSDDQNQALPGVNVSVKGTTNGTVTNVDGTYQVSDVAATDALVFSFIGYQRIEVAVNGRSTLDVSMLTDITSLDEIIIVGYGVQKKSVATASLSKVDTKDIEGFSVPRVDQILQGQVAGVTFKSASGQPGSAQNIFIRGIGTNGDNSPLIIIDGIVANDNFLQNLNPGDIESVQVMKDGASTAIYGARAANGIIMVTSKKAKAGKASLTYNVSYGTSQPWRIPSMLNSQQYVKLITEKYANGGTPLQAGFPDENTILNDTDWMGTVFETGSTQSHQLSFSNGTEKGTVLGSISYYDQKGVIAPEKSNIKRITARLNTEAKVNDFLSVGQNLFVVHSANERIPENNALGSPLADALVYDPTTAVYSATEQYSFAQSPFVQKEYINPLSRIFISNNEFVSDELLGNAYIRITPVKNLVFKSDVGIDYFIGNGRSFSPNYDFTPAFSREINGIVLYENKSVRWQWENYVSYSKTLSSHFVEATVGTTLQEINSDGFTASSGGIPEEHQFDPDFWYIDSTQPDSLKKSSSYGLEREALASVFGRINYNYDEKYLVSVTMRRDGSTKFGPDNRFGIFPSISAGWIISREKFWPTTAVNFLKLRTSYGVNGNDRIPSLSYIPLIGPTGSYSFGKPGSQGIYNGQSGSKLPNPSLQWEESKQLDIGLEMGMFNDQLTIELDYFSKTTSNLLMAATVPLLLGSEPPTDNVGEVVNTGMELEAKYRKSFDKWNFQIGLTAATLKNRVTKVDETAGFINGYNWPIRNAVITRMEVGRPVGYFRGYKTEGIFNDQNEIFSYINSDGDPIQPNAEPGDIKFVDVNGDGVITEKDITEIGKPWADFTYGLNLTVAYSNFDLRMLVAGTLGNDIYRSYERQDLVNNNYQTEWLNRWTESNPNAEYPRLTTNDTNNNSRASDFYVESGSYLRIKNLQLGYSLPGSLLSKLKLSNLRVYVSADNLLTLTGYTGLDPEIGTSGWILDTSIDKGFYPQNRTLSMGLNVSF